MPSYLHRKDNRYSVIQTCLPLLHFVFISFFVIVYCWLDSFSAGQIGGCFSLLLACLQTRPETPPPSDKVSIFFYIQEISSSANLSINLLFQMWLIKYVFSCFSFYEHCKKVVSYYHFFHWEKKIAIYCAMLSAGIWYFSFKSYNMIYGNL